MLVNEVFLVVCLYAQVSEKSSSQRVGDDDASLSGVVTLKLSRDDLYSEANLASTSANHFYYIFPLSYLSLSPFLLNSSSTRNQFTRYLFMYTLYIEKNLMLIRNYKDNSLAYRTSEFLMVLTLT